MFRQEFVRRFGFGVVRCALPKASLKARSIRFDAGGSFSNLAANALLRARTKPEFNKVSDWSATVELVRCRQFGFIFALSNRSRNEIGVVRLC